MTNELDHSHQQCARTVTKRGYEVEHAKDDPRTLAHDKMTLQLRGWGKGRKESTKQGKHLRQKRDGLRFGDMSNEKQTM